MRTVKFITGTDKKTFILNQDYKLAIKEMNPWQTKWNYESIEEQFGITIASFKKDPITLGLSLKFRGSENQISQNLNGFFEACEKDIINKTAGRLYVDDEYLQGYFLERETNPSETFYGYQQDLEFFAPYPFWIKEVKREFYKQEDATAGNGLDYNYDYDYDYTLEALGVRRWNNQHYAPSEFIMNIYGAVENPRITIAGHPYIVNVQLEATDYLTINSRNNTVTKTQNNGVVTNIFKYRNTAESVFQKIPAGENLITWSGLFGFDITLFLERSEPAWI